MPLVPALSLPQFGLDATGIAWLGGLVALGLVLLYLIAPRRRQVQVPFSGLWQQVLARREARALGKRWQRLWSLLLLLALAALLLASLAEPIWRPERFVAAEVLWRRHTVLVLDTSASMATQDGRGRQSRLAAATEAARDWLARLPADENVALLTAAGTVQVRRGFGSERKALLTALDAASVQESGLDLAAALQTAEQMLQDRTQPRIVLVSDGGPPVSAAAAPGVRLEHLYVGPAAALQAQSAAALAAPVTPAALDDLAVEQVRIRPQPDDPDRGTLTVQVRNDSGKPAQARLLVAAGSTAQSASEFADESLLRQAVQVELPPGPSTHEVADLDLGEPRFAVRVAHVDRTFRDVAPYNDAGYAVVAEQKRLRVLLVSPGNQFLRSALQAQLRVELLERTPSEYDPDAFASRDFARHQVDLVVLDQAQKPLPPGMPGLEVAIGLPAGSTETVRLAQAPNVVPRAAEHPLLRSISFADTNFDRVRILPARQGDTVLAIAEGAGPVLVARSSPVRQVVWGMDLLDTDLPMRYAFPLLVANTLGWLAGEDEPLVQPLEPGRPWAVQIPQEGRNWQYLEPGQPPRAARLSAGLLLASSERQGIHVWQDADGHEVARPTALPGAERPQALAVVGEPLVQPAAKVSASQPTEQPRFAGWLLAALAGLCVEWWLYQRRRTV